MNDYRVTRTSYTWTKTGAGAGLDADEGAVALNIEGADEIRIQIDTTATAHTSSSFDLNLYLGIYDVGATPAVVQWDTTVFQAITAHGDATITTYRVADANNFAPRADQLKITGDNNNNNAAATVVVWVLKRVL